MVKSFELHSLCQFIKDVLMNIAGGEKLIHCMFQLQQKHKQDLVTVSYLIKFHSVVKGGTDLSVNRGPVLVRPAVVTSWPTSQCLIPGWLHERFTKYGDIHWKDPWST